MAGQKYGSSNPFLTEPEASAGFGRTRAEDDYEDFQDDESRLEQLRAKKRMLEDRQIEATQRSLATIAETQDIGNATARELLAQGEKLESTERKLDTIEYVTKLTQRHITGIRSVFGSLKNWARGSGKDGGQQQQPPPEPARAPSKLASLVGDSSGGAVASSRPMPEEPAMLRVRLGDDFSYDADEDRCKDGWKGASSARTGAAASFAPAKSVGGSGLTRGGASSSRLDDNLDLMADGVQQLKNLAIGLGDEIEKQNTVIDRISIKADRVDLTLNNQTSQIRKLL